MAKKAFSFASLLGLNASTETEKDDPDLANYRQKAKEDDRYAQAENESDDDYKKRCAALEAEDNEHEEPDGDEPKAESQALAERKRCAQIIAHGIQLNAVEQAGVFAFDTDMSATAAIAALNAGQQAGKPPQKTLATRMAGVKTPKVPSETGNVDAESPEGKANAILLAGKKARGEI